MIFVLLAAALASEPLLRECTVSVGQVQTCSATAFTGTTPLERDTGRVYVCTVAVGREGSCKEPFTGSVPLVRAGKVVRCEITSGIVTRCDATGFTGNTVLRR